MAKKSFFKADHRSATVLRAVGMLGMVLAFGLAVVGCNDGSTDKETDKDSDNPFVGTYEGNGGVDNLVMTDTGWTSDLLGSGSYTYSGNSAAVRKTGQQIGTATISGNTLTIVTSVVVIGNNNTNYPASTYPYTKR
jgi:hypothetical protein